MLLSVMVANNVVIAAAVAGGQDLRVCMCLFLAETIGLIASWGRDLLGKEKTVSFRFLCVVCREACFSTGGRRWGGCSSNLSKYENYSLFIVMC